MTFRERMTRNDKAARDALFPVAMDIATRELARARQEAERMYEKARELDEAEQGVDAHWMREAAHQAERHAWYTVGEMARYVAQCRTDGEYERETGNATMTVPLDPEVMGMREVRKVVRRVFRTLERAGRIIGAIGQNIQGREARQALWRVERDDEEMTHAFTGRN